MPKPLRDTAYVSPWSRVGVTEDAIRMLHEGLSHTQIAKLLNTKHRTTFSRNAVIGKLSRLGEKLDKPVLTKRDILNPAPAPKMAKDDKPKPVKHDYVSPFPARPVMTCDEGGVPLMKAVRCQCRDVIGFRDGDYVFCGKPTISESSSWCSDHASLYIQPQGIKAERSLKRSVEHYSRQGSQPRSY